MCVAGNFRSIVKGFQKPFKLNKETPREIMNRRMIKPLDISSLGGLRTDDFGQLVRCPSVLYHIADKYDKEIESVGYNLKRKW
ncbi:unnamed protein product [Heligmosomoides polygyrus]|uniref:40S ribosomal protein S15 n=1 Tax=Heligmosomoides polygyrus TaxID=6339 RepID=A0A183FJK8_HELPZ|nr:unnamed protein product [Heligmosomoides polygyrus]